MHGLDSRARMVALAVVAVAGLALGLADWLGLVALW